MSDATVLVRGERIVAVGPRQSVTVPEGAEVIDGERCSVVPGLIDAHFHIERDYQLPRLFLSHGVTSVRDPGQWLHDLRPDSPIAAAAAAVLRGRSAP